VRFHEPRPSFDFFGTGAEKTERLVLQAAWIDYTFIRNKLIFDTLNDIGAWAPRLGYARIYINGELNGLYQVIERVDEHFLKRHGLDRNGNLYKAEDEGADFRPHERTLVGFAEVTNEDGRAEDLDDLLRAVLGTEVSYEAYQRELATRISFEDFVHFNIVMSHVLNLDTFIKNYYLYHDPAATSPAAGSVFRIIHWDADASFGIGWNTPRADQLERAALWSEPYDTHQDNELARRMFSIPAYRTAYLARFEELLRGPLSPGVLGPKADALFAKLEPFIRADLSQWRREQSFDTERAFLKQMIELRARVMTQSIATVRASTP
jgi:spore coat protein H